MENKPFDRLYNNGIYRIMYMKSIVEQIKEDYSELSRLWEGSKNSPMEKHQVEEYLRLVCWLRQGISLFRELSQIGIENLSCGEIDLIEQDIQKKEKTLGFNRDFLTEYTPFPL